MSSGPLDVSLRVRLRYQADGARQALGDLDQVNARARQLGGLSAGRIGQDLRGMGSAAQGAGRALADTAAQAAKLGAEGGAGRLEAGLKRLEAPAVQATGRLEAVGRAAARLGAVDPGRGVAAGLQAAGQAAASTEQRIADLSRATARFGVATTVTAFAGEFRAVGGAAQGAARDVAAAAQAATKFGAAPAGPRDTARDLRLVARAAKAATQELTEMDAVVDRVGRRQGRGVAQLGEDLAAAVRQAELLNQRLAGLDRHHGPPGGGYGRGGHGRRFDFGNEALMASGLGGGLRFGMSGAAAGGLAAGAGIVATAGLMAKASREAITFESAMAEVRKAVDGLTPDKLAEMERVILRASRTTGIAKEQMAQLVAQAGFAGRPAEDLPRFAEFGAKAAGAFGMTPEATGDALAKMGNVFKLSQAGIEDLADGINVLGDNTASKERQIVDFLYKAGSQGQALGLTALQTGAIGAAIISTGKEADVAATGFNAFASRLQNADRQGKDFKEGLRALGLSARQIKTDIAANPLEATLKVLERLDKLPGAKKADVANRLGGGEYGDDLLNYAGAVEQMRTALAKLQNQADRSGSVEKTFKIFDATTERSIARMTANIDAFAAKIGQRFTPAIRESAGVVEKWFGGMVKAMELSERASALAAKLGAGTPLDAKEQAELDANPKLKAETNRRVEQGREDKVRRDIVEDEGRRAARAAKPAQTETKPEAPREPDDEDRAAAAARERTRARMQEQIRQLDAEIEVRRRGGFETMADRRRLHSLRQQYERQFPAPAEPAPTRPPAPEASAPAPTRPSPSDALPGTGKRSDLSDGARVSLAAYHDTVERGLERTERSVRDSGRRMRDALAIGTKVDLAGLMRADPSQQIRIERASLGGAGRGVSGGGSAGMPRGDGFEGAGVAARSEALGGGSGPAVAPRIAPGRFGGLIPPRAGERRGDAPAGRGAPERTGPAGNGGAHERFGDGGGTRGAARTGEMMGYAMDQLRREGVPEQHVRQSAGHLVGQAHMESGLDPNKSHDGGTGYGIYGARDPSPGRGRRTDMLAWLARNGYAKNSAEGQMRYMAHEAMTGRYPQTRRVLMGEGTGDIEQDTDTITREFERPAVINRRSGAVRNAMRVGPQGEPGGERPHVEGAGEPGAGANGQHDPLAGRARRYSSEFGMRQHPVRGGRRMHWGQDLAAPAGTPVTSMQAGRVSGINRHGDVTVTHGDGSSKTYRHIDPGGIRMGQEVEAGGPLGRLRAHDRRSTGPHLHLEARDPQGRRYDPREEIEAANRRHNGQPPTVAGPGVRNADRPAPPAEEAMRSPRGPVPVEGERGVRSPRFVEPRMLEVRARPAAEPGGGAGRGGAGGGFGNGVTQHFHGGFDAAEVARRSTLERNREVRRGFAHALGDVGRPA